MNKRLNYKLLAALTSFAFSLLCLTATTLAWFSLSNTLVVDMINIYLTSGEELEFGLKADSSDIQALKKSYGSELGEWVGDIFYVSSSPKKPTKGVVTQDMLEDFGYLRKNDTLAPVSSVHQENWFDADNVTSIFPQFTKHPTREHIKGDQFAVNTDNYGYYYQFEFFMRTSKLTRRYMYLNEKTFLAADVAKNKVVSDREGFDYDRLNNVEKYLRMSILTEKDYIIYEPHPTMLMDDSYEKTAFFGRMDLDGQDGIYDYSQDNYKEILYGSYQNEDKIVYREEARIINQPFTGLGGGFLANSYEFATPVDVEESLKNGVIGEYENTLKPIDIKNDKHQVKAENALAEVGHDIPTRIVVSVWAEGWDRDCNALSQNSHFEFSLVFNTTDPRDPIYQ